MATLKPAKTENEIKKMPVNSVRIEYGKLAYDYNRIIENNILLCPSCNTWQSAEDGFYLDRRYATNRFPMCKRCILKRVEQRVTDKDLPNETKESVQNMCQYMDKPYDDKLYETCVKGAMDDVTERTKHSPWSIYIVNIQSLPQWKGKTWKDSDFGNSAMSIDEDEIRIIQKTVKEGRKRFGSEYSNEELMFLETEYKDWITRYECNSKAQEEIFKNLSTNRLERKQAIKSGKPTKEIDKTFQDLLATQNIQPRQNSMDTMSDAQTMGTLLQKFEETRPLPEIDEELKDVDKIGLYFDVFFRGHAAKMLGLKNAFSHIYEKFMKRYTVDKPEYSGEEDSEAIFEKVFGTNIEE